jgi:hypothetical protein
LYCSQLLLQTLKHRSLEAQHYAEFLDRYQMRDNPVRLLM